jgi:microcystin degradation protein MlrC
MRIGIAGIGHEKNTFSTLRTRLDDFWIRRGAECVEGEFWEGFGDEVEFVPCLVASAMPNGLVAREAYLALRDELLVRLKAALPLDGLFLQLHGAMHVEGIGDGETDLLREIRKIVGPEMVIAASLDLHGNISPEFVDSVNVLTALRTAPHIDGPETRARGLGHLIRCLREGSKPKTWMVKLPLLLPGENAVTAIEPSKSLYQHLETLEQMPGIWDASLMISCAWTDSPYTAVSTLVVGDPGSDAPRLAQEFAEMVWARRAEFGPEVETIPAVEALEKAFAFPTGPVFVSDSGDNPTAGGAGDTPFMLKLLLAMGAKDVLVGGLADAEAIKLCGEAEIGDELDLALGGKLDAVNCTPLKVRARLLRRHEDTAVVEIEGVTVLLTETRRPFHTLEAFAPLGADPLSWKVVVVKQGYLAPDLRARCATTYMALSPGFTDLRLTELPYREVRRPVYPLDADASF